MRDLFKVLKKNWILILVATVIMMMGQLSNFWGAATPRSFGRGVTSLSDGFVLGKMAYTEQNRLFENIGMLVQVLPPDVKKLNRKQEINYRRNRFIYSRQAFLKKTKIVKHNEYLTKVALHGFVYSAWNKAFSPAPTALLNFINFQKSLLVSLVLSFIIVWVRRMTNMYAALLLLFSLVFSPIMTLMGKSLYFASYTFFLPFLVATLLLHLDYVGKLKFSTKHYIIVAATFLLGMLCESFEFISTRGLMAVTPFFFYGLLKADYGEMAGRIFKAGIAYGIAILLGLTALLFQIKTASGSWAAATEHIKYSYSKRASGEMKTKKKISERLQESIDANRAEVVNIYFHENALYYQKGITKFGVQYKYIFYLYAFAALLLLFFQRKIPEIADKKLVFALIVGALVAMSAPLSWYILMKGHSYIHFHLNTLLWFMPFMIFGWMIVGYAIGIIAKYFKSNKKAPVEVA